MIAFRVKLSRIRITFAHDFGNARRMRRVDAGVIEKTQITFLHTVAQKVARLKIAHAVPVRFLVAPQIIYGIAIGFGLDDPVVGRHGRGTVKDKKTGRNQLSERSVPERKKRHASKMFHRHVVPGRAMLIVIHNKAPHMIGLAIVTVLIALSAFLMLRHARQAGNSSPTGSSSSQFNTLFQPKPVSKKLHCRTVGALPDPGCTPGAMITGITQEHVCAPGYAQAAGSLSQNQQRLVYSAYDIALHAPDQYQIDHLISTDLGGSNDPANLWPQSGEPKPGYKEKDAVEAELHKRVCDGKMRLNEAQRIIATDWVGFYARMTQ